MHFSLNGHDALGNNCSIYMKMDTIVNVCKGCHVSWGEEVPHEVLNALRSKAVIHIHLNQSTQMNPPLFPSLSLILTSLIGSPFNFSFICVVGGVVCIQQEIRWWFCELREFTRLICRASVLLFVWFWAGLMTEAPNHKQETCEKTPDWSEISRCTHTHMYTHIAMEREHKRRKLGKDCKGLEILHCTL